VCASELQEIFRGSPALENYVDQNKKKFDLNSVFLTRSIKKEFNPRDKKQ
jgi:hypothetical protein